MLHGSGHIRELVWPTEVEGSKVARHVRVELAFREMNR